MQAFVNVVMCLKKERGQKTGQKHVLLGKERKRVSADAVRRNLGEKARCLKQLPGTL